ncbi:MULTISPECIES: hypothetical protein [unclassified Nostoc]|nr:MULTISPECIES: hypothetical protein [unclassified Nostoc]MDZ8123700.1 hypothetical protein [Nostoc sp. CmiVER01]MDZ8225694.1 hypothetical protein [Nostoc sp. ChiVER01]
MKNNQKTFCTILGLKADAAKQQLKVQPNLPDFLTDLEANIYNHGK